jgi:hypothetical protein
MLIVWARALPLCLLATLLVLGPRAVGGAMKHGEGWTLFQQKVAAVLAVRGARYLPATRRILVPAGDNRTCPELRPEKLAPGDPVGSRPLGGVHRKDAVLGTLHACAVGAPARVQIAWARAPFLDN